MNDFLQVMNGVKPDKPPVWLMRQAGRYLPEYRELRATAGGFMEAVLNPDMATEITLQPLRRYPQLDAAILFSDILVIPYALGLDVTFTKGEGPAMPALDEQDLPLRYDAAKLAPVIETVSRLSRELPADKTLIGFAGSPWTVACYMIAGRNHDDFLAAKKWAFAQPERLDALLEVVADATIAYLGDQVTAGAQVVQLFESWGGSLTGHDAAYERFILKPTQKIVAALKQRFPNLPVIGFPRHAGTMLPRYVETTGVNAVGLDWQVDLAWADNVLPKNFPVQGNLDPALLLTGGTAMTDAAKHILTALQNRPFIFNLGHGVIQFTPPEHVAQLLNVVKS